MKQTLSPARLPLLVLGLGGIGLVLGKWFYGTGVDDRDLLVLGHPAGILLALLAIAVPVFLFLTCRTDRTEGTYRQNFPASPAAFIGSVVEAVGIFILSMGDLMDRTDVFCSVTGILGVVCFPALVVCGYCRWKQMRPSFLLHGLICLFFALHLFSQYRIWSSDPQFPDYGFQMLANIGLMMAAYQRTAFDLDMGNRGLYRFYSLGAVFFCCLSLATPGAGMFQLATAAGVYTDLCAPELATGKETP